MLKHRPETAAALARRFLEPGDAVLDIGAADGTYTCLYAARVGPTGEVVAVEPHPDHLSALRQSVGALPWVTVTAAAAGATNGSAPFYAHARKPTRSSLYARNVKQPDAAALVPIVTIDALVASMRQTPALIQVDAQGAEAEILRGASRTLRLPMVWVIEVWPVGVQRAGSTLADVLRPFEVLGYRPESAHGHAVSWRAARRACEDAGATKSGHVDLVMVPESVPVAVSA